MSKVLCVGVLGEWLIRWIQRVDHYSFYKGAGVVSYQLDICHTIEAVYVEIC